jgi:hypothetical protein
MISAAGEVPVTMLDASRGGFKLRFEPSPLALEMLSPLPRDVQVITATQRVYPASGLWIKDGLAGFRFYQHQSLDDIAILMTAPFRLQPLDMPV